MSDAPVGSVSLRSIGLLAFALLVATGIQSVVPSSLTVFSEGGPIWGRPDSMLVLALVAALLSDAGIGCLVGFGAGLLTAAMTGETMGSYLVSRTIAGFVAGAISGRFFRANAAVVILSVLVGAFVAEAVYGLAAPPPGGVGLALRLEVAGLSILWDGLLALPIAWLLRRWGWGEGRN